MGKREAGGAGLEIGEELEDDLGLEDRGRSSSESEEETGRGRLLLDWREIEMGIAGVEGGVEKVAWHEEVEAWMVGEAGRGEKKVSGVEKRRGMGAGGAGVARDEG